jgi:hypothetical protein
MVDVLADHRDLQRWPEMRSSVESAATDDIT